MHFWGFFIRELIPIDPFGPNGTVYTSSMVEPTIKEKKEECKKNDKRGCVFYRNKSQEVSTWLPLFLDVN